MIVMLMGNQNQIGRGLVANPSEGIDENHNTFVGGNPERRMALIE
jgi:hypothetical protein